MAKLPNQRFDLDQLVNGDKVELVAVSDLTDPSAFDPEGVTWRTHVLKEYRVQRTALTNGTLSPGKELLPHYAIETLEDNTELFYTVMSAIVPSHHSYGFNAVGMIRPDVVRLGDGTPYVKLWYGPIVNPSHRGPRQHTLKSGRTLVDLLMREAIERMKPVAGEDPMIFMDSDNSLRPHEYSRYGFAPMVRGLEVPNLRAEGAAKDKPFSTVDLYIRMPAGTRIHPSTAWEMVNDYLVNGYEVPENGNLTRLAADQLARQLK